MSFSITYPSDTKAKIDAIRAVIGRNITVIITISGEPCTASGCFLDPTTNLSTNPFCAACGGNYWINTASAWVTSGHIRWRKVDQPLWTPGGIVETGDCTVTITYSDLGLRHVKNSRYFLVDGEELYMKSYTLRGVPAINRIRVTLLESPNT